MKIKIVRDDKPNEEGRWIDLPGNAPQLRSWTQTAEALERFVPCGYHLVAVSNDNDRHMWQVTP